MRKQNMFFTECERKCLQNTVRCLRNTFIFFLFHISSFFKDVPQSLSLDRFLFCCCDVSTGLARCLQGFANVLSAATVFAMFAKMFTWFRNLFLRSWVADFIDISILQLRKCLRKCFRFWQLCKNVCKVVRVCKNVCKKIFCGGAKIIFIFIQQDSRKIYFVLYSHPLLALGNRERRLALYCGQY